MDHVNRNSGILRPQETMSSEERRIYQENFLREILETAFAAGTPIREALKVAGANPSDIKTLEDLQQIRTTKKKDLSEAQKRNPPFGGFLTVSISDLLRIHQSPGPIYDPVGRMPDYWRWECALFACGIRKNDVVVNTFAYHLTPAGHMFEEGAAGLGAVVIPTGVGNTETQIEIIKNLRVTGYIGTPSFLLTIYKRAAEMGIDVAKEFRLEIGFLLAEMLPESLRKRFADEYHLIGRQAYGTADVGCVAYECPYQNGMHIHYDTIVEICDPDTGKPVPIGEPGEVVVTPNNRIYPLIRFGTGDISSMVEDSCPCGRTGPRLSRIMGRVDQVTKVKGMFVHPSQVERVIAAHQEISRARLVVDRPHDQDVMTLEVELKEPAREGLVAAIEQTMREVLKLKGKVSILPAGTLPEGHKIVDDIRKWD